MNHASKRLMIAGLLSCIGFAVAAQGTPPQPPLGTAPGSAPPVAQQQQANPGPGKHRGPEGQRGMHRPDPAKMAEFHAKRQADLKAKLKITASQESAWSRFTDATKPPAARPERPNREEFAKLTTPQRIDRMQQLKAQRDAEMAKRAEATKSLYAALTPEQQKAFDAETMRGPRHHGPGHPPKG
jgi:Spy/CpxP family protein refolding chaperone